MPELKLVSSIITSSSREKSPYSASVHKKLLGELGAETPMMVPRKGWNVAFPVNCFHPVRVVPSNNGVQFFCARMLLMEIKEINRDARKNLFICQTII